MFSFSVIYVHQLDPFLIRFGGDWGIRYYGLAYLAGFLIVFFGLRWASRKGWTELPVDRVGDFLTWVIVGTLAGGRLGYCLLYDFQTTLADPVSVIAFWRGGISGMASHGAFVGVVLAIGLFCQKHGFRMIDLLDQLSLWAPPGIFLGRIANFVNGELWGRPTNGNWGVLFPDAPLVAGRQAPRHPSQLYEAVLEGAVLFLVCFFLMRRGVKPGVVSGVFLVLYGIVRIFAECFREPDAHIGYYFGWVTQGQILSLFLIAAGMLFLIFFQPSKEGRPGKVQS